MRDKARPLAALAVGIGLIGVGAGFGGAGGSSSATPLTGSAQLTSYTRAFPGSTAAKPVVAPLHGLRQADLIVVASTSLPSGTLARIRKLSGVTAAESLEAARIQLNGKFTAVLGVNPSTFRSYAAKQTAASDKLWQNVAAGAVSVSYTMGQDDKLQGRRHRARQRGQAGEPAGRRAGHGRHRRRGRGGLGPGGHARWACPPQRHRDQCAQGQPGQAGRRGEEGHPARGGGRAADEPGHRRGDRESGQRGEVAAGTVDHSSTTLSAAEDLTFLKAGLGRQGLPYVWGASGPNSFDCSGLVQWAMAQAGIQMPRVAADQARTGPAVPVSQLQPGDLLFYHTDPTDPGYISHVAIYLGNDKMLQAPQTGENVEVVPADLSGSEYAGRAVRVDPALAAQVAGNI